MLVILLGLGRLVLGSRWLVVFLILASQQSSILGVFQNVMTWVMIPLTVLVLVGPWVRAKYWEGGQAH